MVVATPTYGALSRQPPHRSFFRERLARRAVAVPDGADPVHEYLVDQANLRGAFGAWSAAGPRNAFDPDLMMEEIVVGLLQPHAPAEPRIVKLIVRILQRKPVSLDLLLLLARRERASGRLAWIANLVPEEERTGVLPALRQQFVERPPREGAAPPFRLDPRRFVYRPGIHR